MKLFNYKIKTAKKLSRKAGFTLIEMLVAVFVFSVIMTISTGAIFSIVSANKTSQALKSVLDNLSSAVDSMSRNISYGTMYNCSGDPGQEIDFSKSTSCLDGDKIFAFTDKDGHYVSYFFDDTNGVLDGVLQRCEGSVPDGNCTQLTAPEVHIKDMKFYVAGAGPSIDEGQPSLRVTISGYAQSGSSKSEFNLQTMISQRSLVCKQEMKAAGLCGQP